MTDHLFVLLLLFADEGLPPRTMTHIDSNSNTQGFFVKIKGTAMLLLIPSRHHRSK